MKKQLIVLILSLGFIIGCEKDTQLDNENPQFIYFEHLAMTFNHISYLHWIIDNEGSVRVHHNPDSVFFVDINNIENSISYFDSIVYETDLDEFDLFKDMISSITNETIDSTVQNRADFGFTNFYCFNGNKEILLSSMSDVLDCVNSDTNAIKVDNWLKGIHMNIYSR
jgi:hypothetical protein